MGVAVGHTGSKTGDATGSLWHDFLRTPVWVFPELWLGHCRQVSVGAAEWKHWCCEDLCLRSKVAL